MKRFILIFSLLIIVGNLAAQTPTIANLTVTGSNIQWYSASTGGVQLDPSTILVNGTHYYASQTVNCTESANRLDITVNITF